MTEFMIKSALLYHLEMRHWELADEIYSTIELPDDLSRLIVEYSHYRIDEYSHIFKLELSNQDRAWPLGSMYSRWSNIKMDFRNLAKNGVVEIYHSHHQMSITKFTSRVIRAPFETICIAIRTCDIGPLMELIMPADTVLTQSDLPIHTIKFVIACGIQDFLNM